MNANPRNTLTSLQCRMARAGLQWTVEELSKKTHVGRVTITRYENGANSTPATRAVLRRTFEEAGVEFYEDYGVLIPNVSNGN